MLKKTRNDVYVPLLTFTSLLETVEAEQSLFLPRWMLSCASFPLCRKSVWLNNAADCERKDETCQRCNAQYVSQAGSAVFLA